jgi:hypothetical protein
MSLLERIQAWAVRLAKALEKVGRPPRFHSPDELWHYAMEAVSLLEHSQQREAAAVLRRGVTYPTSSGWEWLGELGTAAEGVLERYPVSDDLRDRLTAIARTAKPGKPYGV